MTHASLFSGIGGFDLAAEQVGWENVFHVERDPFCQSVLKHHFPNSIPYEDITKFDATDFRGRIRVLSGGFPCQPFSAAGERKGDADDRHLWPEMLRVISEIMPAYVVAENVRGLLSWNEGVQFEAVQTDLGSLGYEVFPAVLPSAGVGAPHRRDRIFWICRLDAVDTDHERDSRKPGHVSEENGEVREWHYDAQSCYAGATDATNTNGKECQRGSSASERERKETEQRGDGVQRTTTRLSKESDATNADALRLQQRTDSGEVGRGQSEVRKEGNQPASVVEAASEVKGPANSKLHGLERGVPSNQHRQEQQEVTPKKRVPARGRTIRFEEFPTVPPVCGGDDGLPQELDGITIPKWRRESIKAYGNAVCVPLVKAIFEVIDNDCKQQ